MGADFQEVSVQSQTPDFHTASVGRAGGLFFEKYQTKLFKILPVHLKTKAAEAVFSRAEALLNNHLRLKAGRLVFSSCEALLLIERARKNAEMPAFNSNGGADWT